jgi:aspartate carbamoyltransferase catalytic subunit
MKRDLISIEDLSDAGIASLLRHAAAFERSGASQALQGAILATLFLEPSTRTRLSFEAAMHRLGGAVITSADPQASSSAKGETLADTVRMVDAYADVIVVRHPAPGAARAAAKAAKAPVLNAGDGGHEHPSQTLVDLYTLEREVGRLTSLTVVLYGDLRYGRTTHSLVRALVRFGAKVVALSEPGLELPDYVCARLAARGAQPAAARIRGLDALFPGEPPAVTLFGFPESRGGGAGVWSPSDGEVDAVYVTRLQRERLPAARADRPVLPSVDARFLAVPAFRRAIVMHPLPRTSEIDPKIDGDRRAAYFRQAAFGVPVRMALLSWALGRLHLDGGGPPAPSAALAGAAPDGPGGCGEPACISVREPSSAPAEFVGAADGSRRCAYCEGAWR